MESFVDCMRMGTAFVIILVVLIQGGNQGGMSAALGGGNTQGVFGAAGATSFLGKVTYGAMFLFMSSCIAAAILKGRGEDVGLSRSLERRSVQQVAPQVPGKGA